VTHGSALRFESVEPRTTNFTGISMSWLARILSAVVWPTCSTGLKCFAETVDQTCKQGMVRTSNPYNYNPTTPGATYTFNGVLQFSSSSVVYYPAGCVLLWSGILDNNMLGRVWANPNLECNDSDTGACIYVSYSTSNDQGNGSQDTVRGEPGEPCGVQQ
jgi:hypothetical protein